MMLGRKQRSQKKRTQVVVAGAGPTGLLTALLLSRRGFDVHILDQAWRVTGRSYAAALHPPALALLDELGLADEVVAASHRIERVAFYEGRERSAEVELSRLGGKYGFLAVLPQSTLEALLERELQRREVAVGWLERVASVATEGNRVTTEVEVLESVSSGYAVASTSVEVARTLEIESEFLIGADGLRSLVRRSQDIPYEKWGEPEVYDVFEFNSDDEAGQEVRIALAKDTSDVLWTLPNGRQRFSFQVKNPRDPERHREKSRLAMAVPGEASPRSSAELLEKLVRERAPWFGATLGDIAWAGEVVFEKRLVSQFGGGRIWLVGDAAHQTGPIGVRSMNEGLLEAARLAAAVAGVLGGEASEAGLKAYDQSCLMNWRRLFAPGDSWIACESASPWVRRNKDRILSCLPGSGKEIVEMAAQIGLAPAPGKEPSV